MTTRTQSLQAFVDAAHAAFSELADSSKAKRSVREVFDALSHPALQRIESGRRLPVCNYLDDALSTDFKHAKLRHMVGRFKEIEPWLEWRQRTDDGGTASTNFADGHANVMIVGPSGLEVRDDVWLGATLLAPHVRYPDHDHAPEEVYLVLSEGEFWQGDGDWFSPGLGGSFYNEPQIRHTMRSGAKPLFAFWALLAKDK